MHNARQAFTKSESSENISRALCHNLRSYKDAVFVTGDSVYYKRNDSKRWKEHGKVIGVDGQQILVKHGNTYIRCHPPHVTLKDEKSSNRSFTNSIHADENASKSSTTDIAANKRCGNISTQSEINPTSTESHPDIWSDSDDEQTQNDIEPSNGSALDVRIPKKGTKISYKVPGGEEEIQATLLGRAGKATGKSKYWYNVQNDDQSFESLNFERITERNEIPTESILLTQVSDQTDVKAAKIKELDNWKIHNVYSEVTNNGQRAISTRWVITEKFNNGERFIKARLVARGFEEDDLDKLRTDSPTCGQESLQILMAIIVTNCWKINSLDIKAAFLQGKGITRDLLIKPPKEANTAKLWRLNKTVYGLNDASRTSYLRVRNEFIASGARVSKFD